MKFSKQKSLSPSGRNPVYNERPRSPRAFSYHANRADEGFNTGRMQPREQDVRRQAKLSRYWRQRFGMIVASVVIVVCAVNVLQLSVDPKIVPLTSSSNNYFLRTNSEYEQAVKKLFESSLFNSNKITVNTSRIAQQLKQESPELSDVSIMLPVIGHRPVVYIAPTTPSLVLSSNQNEAYILDQNGKALANVSQVPNFGALHLPEVVDQSGLKIELGSVALPSADVSTIQTIVGQLQSQHYQLSALVMPAAASELDVHFVGKPYIGKFNLHTPDSARQQAGTFVATDQYLAGQHKVPGQYIDVRVDGRAYYK